MQSLCWKDGDDSVAEAWQPPPPSKWPPLRVTTTPPGHHPHWVLPLLRQIMPHKQRDTGWCKKFELLRLVNQAWAQFVSICDNWFQGIYTSVNTINSVYTINTNNGSVAASCWLIVWPDHAWADIIPAASHSIAADSWTFLTLTLLPPRCWCICPPRHKRSPTRATVWISNDKWSSTTSFSSSLLFLPGKNLSLKWQITTVG